MTSNTSLVEILQFESITKFLFLHQIHRRKKFVENSCASNNNEEEEEEGNIGNKDLTEPSLSKVTKIRLAYSMALP